VFSHYSLLTVHQFKRFEILKSGILNNIKSFKTELELNNYLDSFMALGKTQRTTSMLYDLSSNYLDN